MTHASIYGDMFMPTQLCLVRLTQFGPDGLSIYFPATYSFESHIYKGSPQLQINTALLSFRKFALGMHSAEKNVVISL